MKNHLIILIMATIILNRLTKIVPMKKYFFSHRNLLVKDIQISYAIGVSEPVSITIMDYGTSSLPNQELLRIVQDNFDLRPGMIIKELNLRSPIYEDIGAYGHFGREKFSWEKPKKLLF
ncbi:S-adenosylmethionine synthase isoform type-1 [Sarcoptes scabiei]|nr:S-adenosylmethionine synthase isoform type-1 [Sarcoptes scabiei]